MAATLGTDTYPEGRLKSLIETVFRKLGDAAKRSRKLRSDIDTVEVVLRLLKERNCLSLLEEFLETLETPAGANKKNDQLAKEHREAGNKLFQKKKFKEALELYSQSIVTAKPAFEGGEDALPLAYANRSAVFFHLKLYKECKNDIEQAMQTGYPDNLRYKLLQRKGQCHLCEGELELAATAFQSSIELCTQYDVDPQKKDILEELLLRCNTDDTSHSTKPETSSSSSQDGASSGEDKFVESKLLSNASKAVKLTNHGEKGRYILATETICRGEIIIKEKPYGCVLLPSHYNTRCYHCVRKTVAPIPCCTCTHVRYCSVECQQESWKSYHYIECPLWPFLSQAGNFSQLSLRILLKAGWSNIQKYSKEVSNPVSSSHIPGCDTRGNYKSDYNSIYSLITHSGKQPWKDVFFFTLTSILLSTLVTKLISPSDDVDDLLADTEAMKMTEAAEAENKSNRSPSEDESQINGSAPSRHTLDATDADRDRNTSQDNTTVCSNDSNKFLAAEQKLSLGDAEKAVASVLLHHLLQLRCNVHAVTEVATKTDSSTSFVATTQQIRIAVAVYGTASMLNHSCTPNVIAGYDGNQLTIRATEMIKKGGEVLHCYGPRVSDMFRDERLKVLRDQYYFTCKCMFCGIPQEAITPSGALRCPRCSDMSGVYQTPEVTGQCCNFDCHHSWKLGETDEKIENARQLFRVGKTLIGDKNKVKECLSTLHKAYKIQQSVLYKHNKELAETEDCLALCYASFGNYHYAAKYLKLSIKSNIILYGEDSIEIGHELYKLAQILFNCKNVTEGLGVIDKAVKIISDHYGENHSDVKELLQMKAVLKDYKDQ